MLALTATSQCSEISYFNIKLMSKTEGKHIFSFNKCMTLCKMFVYKHTETIEYVKN